MNRASMGRPRGARSERSKRGRPRGTVAAGASLATKLSRAYYRLAEWEKEARTNAHGLAEGAPEVIRKIREDIAAMEARL